MIREFSVQLPQTDENATPLTKMPDCPNCGMDELGMLSKDSAVCYACGLDLCRDSSEQTAIGLL